MGIIFLYVNLTKRLLEMSHKTSSMVFLEKDFERDELDFSFQEIVVLVKALGYDDS